LSESYADGDRRIVFDCANRRAERLHGAKPRKYSDIRIARCNTVDAHRRDHNAN
jgi:hypothetical protein